MKKTKNILAGTVIGAMALQGNIAEAQGTAHLSVPSQESVRPFHVHFSDAQLRDLRKRILATKWPGKETVDDPSQGVQLATMKKIADYWANEYNWRRFEKQLNSLPQFITNIDGLDIHYIQV